MLCLFSMRTLPRFAFSDRAFLSLVQNSHHPLAVWLRGWNISLLLPSTQIHAGAQPLLLSSWTDFIKKSCGGKECHWQKAPQNDGHCHSSSPPGTKRLLGLQRPPSLWPYHRVLSLLSAARQRFKKAASHLLLLSSKFSKLPARLGNNCPCLTCGKLKWSRCAER